MRLSYSKNVLIRPLKHSLKDRNVGDSTTRPGTISIDKILLKYTHEKVFDPLKEISSPRSLIDRSESRGLTAPPKKLLLIVSASMNL